MDGGTQLGHRPALDGLRGLAALLVVATHTAAFLLPDDAPPWARIPGGGHGVDLFFVLSGFLITALLLEEQSDTGTIDLRGFYVRRVRRLLPAAFFVLAAWLWFRAATGAPAGELIATAATVLTYTTNFFHDSVTFGLGHYWTLAVEEQFYFVAPLVLLAVLRRRVSLRAIAVSAAGLAVAVAVWRGYLLAGSPAASFRTDTRADGLLLGVALAAAWKAGMLPSRLVRRVGPWALAAFLALALLAPAAAYIGSSATLTYLAAPALSALVVAACLTPTGVLRAFALAPARWLGRVSYSLYLWHVPVIVLVEMLLWPLPVAAQIVVAFGASLLVAWASYRWIETPFRAHRTAPNPDRERVLT